jgi:hypothetical protein
MKLPIAISLSAFVSRPPRRRTRPPPGRTVSAVMIGFAAKAAIVFSRRFGWRCSRIAFDRNPSALAIGQNISLRLFISLRNFPAIATLTTEFAVQFFCGSAFFVDAPGMIG